jgi:hypothetical protein
LANSAPPPQPIIELNRQDEWANNVGAFATLLDNISAGFNGVYAVGGDLISVVCPECYPGVLAVYQYYSILPNTVSTISMGLWIGQGIISGENNVSIIQASNETVVSLSVSQDSLVAVTTNVAGWTILKEPNIATIVDAGVVAYDYGRSGLGEIIQPGAIPTWINPTISYSTVAGLKFNWRR